MWSDNKRDIPPNVDFGFLGFLAILKFELRATP
jgi:hypothetical protein